MSQKAVTFLAAFPAIQSAIKITGDGGGMRIQLDIPEDQMSEAVKLMLYRQTVIKVTIEPHEQEKHKASNSNPATGNGNGDRTIKRSTAKRRIG